MIKLLNWLSENPIKTIIISTIYFLSTLLLHVQVGNLFKILYEIFTFEAFSIYIIIVSIILSLLLLLYLTKHIINHEFKLRTILYIVLTSLLLILGFDLLISYNVELIHYPQYAILFILVFPLNKKFVETIIICSLLSIIDELYQFISIADARYLDFNDFVLNSIGTLSGAVIVYIITGYKKTEHTLKSRDYNLRKFITSRPLIIAVALLIVCIISFSVNILGYWADDNALYNINKELFHNRPFWHTKPGGGQWHVLYPREGTIILYLLPLIYLGMDIIKPDKK
ncbi:hypothetical protein ACFLS9_06260 [Bacteroidota bacterium]